MEKLTRLIFLCFVTGMFLFQMYNSVKKYISPPIIRANSQLSIEDIELPITYVCQVCEFFLQEYTLLELIALCKIFLYRMISLTTPTP